MALYLHDGAATGHATWCEEALTLGAADGVVISPFFTPAGARRGQPSGEQLADRMRDAGGEVIFDATTHAVNLPGVDNWTAYNTWDLWDGPRGDLSSPALRRGHIERVFDSQGAIGTNHLAPTLALDSPVGGDADSCLELADEASDLDPRTWQSLAGRRGFWLSPDLDIYVGALAALRAPVWVLTHVRERGDYPPDTTELAQTAAICRTVHSLSKRSRVIVAHSDLYGLPAVAAGADSVGSGWHTKQRICAPPTYQRNDPTQVRRAAMWMTYQGLLARLHRNQSETLVNSARATAMALYPGAVAHNNASSRNHHLAVVRGAAADVDGVGRRRRDRVAILREMYENSIREFDSLAARFGAPFGRERASQVEGMYLGLREYAVAEGLWL